MAEAIAPSFNFSPSEFLKSNEAEQAIHLCKRQIKYWANISAKIITLFNVTEDLQQDLEETLAKEGYQCFSINNT